ncbi:MAG TPA: hypothetical protein DEA82_02490 [Flavobacteriaceae bacterium]|nr:hypothetical protein [Flavobacteriaceae bacterium]HBR53096.1 hypothetical protein [Flavobacteriaceae bacterium]|tara:strand:+ start:1522 stop:1731 length:210 start_codon:yes stop_codon:yes gene_type:complete
MHRKGGQSQIKRGMAFAMYHDSLEAGPRYPNGTEHFLSRGQIKDGMAVPPRIRGNVDCWILGIKKGPTQ